jgi:hypothetical protein
MPRQKFLAQMVGDIPRVPFAHIFFMHAILIFWCYFATLSKDLPAVFIF